MQKALLLIHISITYFVEIANQNIQHNALGQISNSTPVAY